MRVIVHEDHRAPVMVSQVWYRAGSMDEFNGTSGVAHVLEHMMFKGTETVPPGEFSKRIAAAGGRENAFTSRDYTAYFQQMQKDRLALSMQLEADRMANLVISDELFAKEIQVVMEERRLRTDDQPQSVVYERLMATAFQVHPYRRPIIGWMNDLQNMSAQDARDWYARWYAPNNATLVVAGDVKADEVFALAKRHFGALPARALPERKPQAEPAQLGEKRIVVKAPAQLPYLLMVWHAPTLKDWAQDTTPYALQILAGVLSGNDSARLQKSLVKTQQIAVDASAGYDAVARGPGLFMVDATPAPGKSVAGAGKSHPRRTRTSPTRRHQRGGTRAGQGAGDRGRRLPARFAVLPGHAAGRIRDCRTAARGAGGPGRQAARGDRQRGAGRRPAMAAGRPAERGRTRSATSGCAAGSCQGTGGAPCQLKPFQIKPCQSSPALSSCC